MKRELNSVTKGNINNSQLSFNFSTNNLNCVYSSTNESMHLPSIMVLKELEKS